MSSVDEQRPAPVLMFDSPAFTQEQLVTEYLRRRVTVTYTNHRGETRDRLIEPYTIRFGKTDHHPEPQWLLTCWDFEKQADRSYALKNVSNWRPWQEPQPQTEAQT